jgi:orotate phosphoribosyltransferase
LAVNVAEPFRWTSGLLAPIYVDCRVVLGFPEQRKLLVDALARMIEREVGTGSFDVVVGGATAGIPMASLLAERFDKPLAYVRKEAKGHGRGQQVEGADVEGLRVLLFDELVSRGSSVSAFVPALRAAGATVEDLVVLLSYDTQEVRRVTAENGVALHALLTLDEALGATEMSDADRTEVARFRETWLV